jgi:hypothetical protein
VAATEETTTAPFFSSAANPFYGKVEPNGKDKSLNGKNSWNLKIVENVKADKMNWRADIRIQVQRLKPEVISSMSVQEQASFGKGVFLRIENELISADHVCSCDTSHLPGGESHYRIVVDILSKYAKENADSGLTLESYKKNTKIQDKKEIAQCIKLTLNTVKRLLSSVVLDSSLDDQATYNSKAFQDRLSIVLNDRKRAEEQKKLTAAASRNGHTFEQQLGDTLKNTYTILSYGEETLRMEYEVGDSLISAREGFEGQACDILGRAQLGDGRRLLLVIQAKNTKNADQAAREKFIKIVKEFRKKYTGDIVLPAFVQKANKSFSSIVTNHFSQNGILLFTSDAVESNDQADPCACICEKLKALVGSLA